MLRALYFRGFQSHTKDYKASDAVGYGITAANAIADMLPQYGVDVHIVQPKFSETFSDMERTRLAWILETQKELLRVDLRRFDLAFIFHSFQQFPCEVRRLLQDLRVDLPIIGYSHGSHWDPTDSYRQIHYPGMEVLDLANLLCLDRVLLVSESFRTVLVENIGRWQHDAAKQVNERLVVVGLPLNTKLIDAQRTNERFDQRTIVFNHSITPGKQPEQFLSVAEEILDRHDARVVVTRNADDPALAARMGQLQGRFPGRFVMGDTYSLPEYFRLLWQSHIQVSTASHETLGISTLEAMYTGNACLLPSRCSYPEITSGVEDALYSSREELIDMIERYLTNETARAALATDLRQRSQRYEPERVVKVIADVMREVVASRHEGVTSSPVPTSLAASLSSTAGRDEQRGRE